MWGMKIFRFYRYCRPHDCGKDYSLSYCFDNGSIHLCSYEETESYQVTEMFINNRTALLGRLLED